MKTGFHDIPAKEYHEDRLNDQPSLSASIAWEMEPSNLSAGSPLHGFRAHPRLGNQAKKTTDAMRFGTICHALLLGESEKIAESPYDDYRKKEAQEWRDETLERGLIPVKKSEYADAVECVKAWCDQLSAMRLNYITSGKNEQSIAWNETVPEKEIKFATLIIQEPKPTTQIYCRSRLDMMIEREGAIEIWDLKTMPKAHPKKVLRKVIDEGLPMKSEFYKRGIGAIRPEMKGRIYHGFIFASIEPPYLITPVYRLDGQFQLIGRKQVQNAIETWAKCLKENLWPGFEPVKNLECPHWALMEGVTEDDDETDDDKAN